jgi:DNA polymerase-3 subunit chi
MNRMPETFFYHLETTPLRQVLPDLLEKVVQRGWRAYVHADADDTVQDLNTHLWSYSPASFLTHGVEGDDLASRQPILLGLSGEMANGADCYLSVAPVDLPDLSATKRCLIVFEGDDAAHLGWARATWKHLKGQGVDLAYWKQDARGKWERAQ